MHIRKIFRNEAASKKRPKFNYDALYEAICEEALFPDKYLPRLRKAIYAGAYDAIFSKLRSWNGSSDPTEIAMDFDPLFRSFIEADVSLQDPPVVLEISDDSPTEDILTRYRFKDRSGKMHYAFQYDGGDVFTVDKAEFDAWNDGSGEEDESAKATVTSRNLRRFYKDLQAALKKVGRDGYDSFDEFKDDLEGIGQAILFNVATDDEYDAWCQSHKGKDTGFTDHYFKVADDAIKKIKAPLAAKYTGFDVDSDKDDTQVFVFLTVDAIGD